MFVLQKAGPSGLALAWVALYQPPISYANNQFDWLGLLNRLQFQLKSWFG
jgi:hypothetical protein